mmetsp:Transcript_57589/g.184927  ORF Transcript_57589/g.184927 Transcript_57589/m.184927 type:complete len:231 (-) Transcript_57589:157-849(-)
MHGHEERGEVLSPHGRAVQQLPEGDRKDIGQDAEQQQRVEDRAHAGSHALDKDQELRHGVQQLCHPRHARKPQQPQQAQARGVAHATTASAHQQHHRSQDPSLPDHHAHHEGVKDKPRVPQPVPLAPEGEEAHQPLPSEVSAEAVLCDLEDGPCCQQAVSTIEVRVYGYPHGIQGDHGKRHPLEPLTARNQLAEADVPIEVAHVIARFRQALTQLLLHRLGIHKHALSSV